MNNKNSNDLNPIVHDADLNTNTDALYKAMCAELAHSRSLLDLTSRSLGLVKELGFSDFLFIRLERLWQSDSECGLLYSFPNELMRVYHEEYMYEFDLIIPYGKANTQPIFSSQVYGYIDNAPFEMELTRKNRVLLQLYKRFRYFEHCIFPLPALNGSGHVLLVLTSIGVNKQEFQDTITPIMATCRALCKAIDSVSTKKFRGEFIDKKDNPVSITRKPLDVLRKLAGADITITDLATEMCISPITAHQHIAAARKALGAKTNIGAVVKAIKAGLIQLD